MIMSVPIIIKIIADFTGIVIQFMIVYTTDRIAAHFIVTLALVTKYLPTRILIW